MVRSLACGRVAAAMPALVHGVVPVRERASAGRGRIGGSRRRASRDAGPALAHWPLVSGRGSPPDGAGPVGEVRTSRRRCWLAAGRFITEAEEGRRDRREGPVSVDPCWWVAAGFGSRQHWSGLQHCGLPAQGSGSLWQPLRSLRPSSSSVLKMPETSSTFGTDSPRLRPRLAPQRGEFGVDRRLAACVAHLRFTVCFPCTFR